jgi:hypothetical protein
MVVGCGIKTLQGKEIQEARNVVAYPCEPFIVVKSTLNWLQNWLHGILVAGEMSL